MLMLLGLDLIPDSPDQVGSEQFRFDNAVYRLVTAALVSTRSGEHLVAVDEKLSA